jgi:lipopolysaccharide/colanic/teichoic acid biosynthesis glycosyltransferase
MANLTKSKKRRLHKRKWSIVSDNYKINIIRNISPAPYFRWKGVLDRAVAAILLIPCLPMTIVLVLLVRLTSRGPGIYCQCRFGKNGRKFFIYKIRTMIHNAEVRTGPVWTQAQDSRVTALGRIMRKYHLDEFPQLFNVLKGEMSLVGPRPERPEFVDVLLKQIPDYSNRMVVRPGITGLAQLNLPPDSDLNSVRRKLMLDLNYIEQADLFMDIRMLICTALRIFKLPALWVLGLQRKVVLAPITSGNGSNVVNKMADKKIITPDSIVHKTVSLSTAGAPAGQDGKRSPKTGSELYVPVKPK